MTREKTLSAIVLFCLFTVSAIAQTSTEKPSFDSIMSLASDNKIPLDEKKELIHSTTHLTVSEQIAIKEKIAEYAEKEKDKGHYITLNAMINVHLFSEEKIDSGKIYLDRAQKVIDQTNNVDALGAFYYQLGKYYDKKENEKLAHENYYKAISYYEQSETKKFLLNFLYYSIGSDYFAKGDLESVAKLVPKMLNIEFDDPYKTYYSNVYSFVGSYYDKMAENDTINVKAHLDSALFYKKKSVEIYHLYHETAPSPRTAKRMVSENYVEIANLYLQLDPENLEPVMENFNKAEEYMDKNHVPSILKYNHLKVNILIRNKAFNEAIGILTQMKELIEKMNHPSLDSQLYHVYLLLANAYESENRFKEAYYAHRNSRKIGIKIDNAARYKLIKELNIIHETAEKEAAINTLNEEMQVLKYRRLILIATLAIVIILLVAILLYFRNKRLKKEKEAAILVQRLEENEVKYQTLVNEAAQRQLRNYMDGLETERIRLARELHDNVANELVAVKMQMGNEVDKESIISSLDKLQDEVRSISHGLIPPVFTYARLPEILNDYAKKQTSPNKTICSVNIQPDDETWDNFSTDLSLEIYRITQEAVSNAIKHGKADFVEIELNMEHEEVELTITDNGKGFDPQLNYQGVGLRIIKERAALINGEIHIDSTPGKGTTIHLKVPTTGK